MFLIYVTVSWIISQGSTLIRKRQNQYSLLLNLNRKKIKKINIKYGDIQIRQHWKVNFLGCLMDGEVMSGEVMAFNIIHKINNKLKFFYRKNVFLDIETDYACCTNEVSFSLRIFCLVSKSNKEIIT